MVETATSSAFAAARPRFALPGLAGIGAPLAIGMAGLGLLFHQEIAAAITVWLGSTAYNHCFLIIPIAAYLIWDRRETLGGIEARPMPFLALAALPLTIAWLAAERIGFMEGRQMIAMTCVELLFLGVLGRRAWWMLCGPLLYLYFLVPFGDFLVAPLQDFTTSFVTHGLDVLGIVNYSDGYTIQIPEGNFYIAEACAGLRFLIASVAFGCLYALLIYRSAWRRAAFIGVSLIVPVIANGFRALGIVTLGHLLGSAQAAETDHILYGWIFFSIVILILVALGLPFREDGNRIAASEPIAPPTPAASAAVWAAVAATVIIVALGPVAALALTRAAGAGRGGMDLAAVVGCRPAIATDPKMPAGGSRYVCEPSSLTGLGVTIQAETFGPRDGPRDILEMQEALTRPASIEDWSSRVTPINGLPWTFVRTVEPTHVAATLLWQNGAAVSGGVRFRLRQGWHSIVGGGSPMALVVIKPDPDLPELTPSAQRDAQLAIEAFLGSAKALPEALDRAAPAR